MTKAYLVAPALLAATLFASVQSCKKKSDSAPSTRIVSCTDSVVLVSGSTAVTAQVNIFAFTYDDDKLISFKGLSKDYQSGSVQYDSTIRTYNYADGKCIITSTNSTTVDTVYLDGDKITKVNSNAVIYHDGTSKVESYRDYQYTWSDDNLASKISTYGDSITFSYNTSKTASIANPYLLADYLDYGRPLFVSKNLITSVRHGSASGGQTDNYDYTFDGSGRVIGLIQTTTAFGPGSSGNYKSYLTFSY